jgi:hypothetical protein
LNSTPKKKKHHLNIEDFQKVANLYEGSQDEKMLSREDVAQLFGVRSDTVSHWLCRKRSNIPYFRIGRFIRFPKAWVGQWAKEREQAIRKRNFEL